MIFASWNPKVLNLQCSGQKLFYSYPLPLSIKKKKKVRGYVKFFQKTLGIQDRAEYL